MSLDTKLKNAESEVEKGRYIKHQHPAGTPWSILPRAGCLSFFGYGGQAYAAAARHASGRKRQWSAYSAL